jgi:hypothetical protein
LPAGNREIAEGISRVARRSVSQTHDLGEIGETCIDIDPTLKAIVDPAAPLTEYAWKFRYPGEPVTASHKEVQSSLHLATKLYNAILARLPSQAKP